MWRTWLEQEAGHGNEAAKSALRGIKYREGRDKEQNSISGEELDPLHPIKKADREHDDDTYLEQHLCVLQCHIHRQK